MAAHATSEKKRLEDMAKRHASFHEEQASDEDDEEFTVDKDTKRMMLPLHVGGHMINDLPIPEHHHFRPMHHYSDHPYYRAYSNNINDLDDLSPLMFV